MYVSINGLLTTAKNANITPANRAFRYGDGIFETIRVVNHEILWSSYHYNRLLESSGKLDFRIGSTLTHNNFHSVINNLFRANHPEGGAARVRFSLYRNDGGYYTPQRIDASYIIESEKLPTELYSWKKDGLSLTVYPYQKKAYDKYSMIKSSSAMIYVMASRYKQKECYDDCLIMNTQGYISEATSSNVFLFKDGIVYTPGLDQACIDGVMRRVICILAKELGYTVLEQQISVSDLEAADEVFLSNAIGGVQWVREFNHIRYDNSFSNQLLTRINEELKKNML